MPKSTMLKFNQALSHDLFGRKQARPATDLGPPPAISLENLRAIVEENQLGPPPRVSLDSLRRLAAATSKVATESIGHDGSLENLQLLVETSSLISPVLPIVPLEVPKVQINTRNLLPGVKPGQGQGILRVWKIEPEAALPAIEPVLPLPAIPEPAPAVQTEIPDPAGTLEIGKFEAMLQKLRELSESNANLEAWIESLKLPIEMDVPAIRARIQEFLKNKSWEKCAAAKAREANERSIASKLWNGFKEMSTAKQILVIIGMSILVAAVGFLTVQLLALLWPSLLGLASSGEAVLIEIGIESFKQRQEPAFHLLLQHAENAKPMSYAWANQYILYKYMR